jgi:hypothetical protein
MVIDFNKSLSYLFSFFAISVSIVTIIITRRNLRKQLRLSKLEEILEILYFLKGYYPSLFRVFVNIENSIKELSSNEKNLSDTLKESIKYREAFIKVINIEVITNKISRLTVLSDAYLPNTKYIDSLKNRIHTVGDVYYNMYMFVHMTGDPSMIKKEDSAVIPRPDSMRKFIAELENNVIVEMNLGYKKLDEKSKNRYFETKFKSDLDAN